jgi:hypothetical protein
MARTSIIQAQRRWPKAINAHLWPYALRKANESLNTSIHRTRAETALERFLRVKVRLNMRDEHPFGCPAYALDSDLHSQKNAGKWEDRARMAIYLGPSPQHTSSVGLLPPQFHVRYDDTFETVCRLSSQELPPSLWQVKAGFVGANESTNETPSPDSRQAGEVMGTEVRVITTNGIREDTPPTEQETKPIMREPTVR